jgi:hypothetical protein
MANVHVHVLLVASEGTFPPLHEVAAGLVTQRQSRELSRDPYPNAENVDQGQDCIHPLVSDQLLYAHLCIQDSNPQTIF